MFQEDGEFREGREVLEYKETSKIVLQGRYFNFFLENSQLVLKDRARDEYLQCFEKISQI